MVTEETSDKLYYTISEVAAMLNVAPSVLRFWEKEFTHVRPRKDKKGNRRYDKDDIAKLKQIYHLSKEQGLTLEGVRQYLKNKQGGIKGKEDVIETLRNLKAFLLEIKQNLD